MHWSYKRVVAIGVSGYELFACVSGRVPPITDICRAHPIAAGIVVGWCAYHFMPPR